MDDRRSLWHIVAVIATLALAVVVAVVAVTRDEREPAAAESPSPSPAPTATASPSGLPGDGPYVVYANGFDLFAFDVSTGDETRLGTLRDDPVPERSRQPGTGRVVAFATVGGDVWSVTRSGAERVGAIPQDAGTSFAGGAASPDDRKLAVAALGPEASVIVMDLQSGRPTVIPRTQRGEYPDDPLIPIAWGLGGTLVYQVPYCECDTGPPGIYALDLTTASSTRLSGTTSESFFLLAVSPSGQALYYGTASEEPPFSLRRLAAGQRGSSVLERASDTSFIVDAISTDGRFLLARRPANRNGATTRLELYDAEGDRQPTPRGAPAGGVRGLALLPRDILILHTETGGIVMVQQGRARTILEGTGPPGAASAYLGWLL